MRAFFSHYKRFFIFFSLLSSVIMYLIYEALQPVKRLPVYQPNMVNVELVDSTLQHVKKYHRIADFSLVNQNGDTITQEDYRDKIYVADFFFTTHQRRSCFLKYIHQHSVRSPLPCWLTLGVGAPGRGPMHSTAAAARGQDRSRPKRSRASQTEGRKHTGAEQHPNRSGEEQTVAEQRLRQDRSGAHRSGAKSSGTEREQRLLCRKGKLRAKP